MESKRSEAVSSEDIESHRYKTWLVLECRNLEPIGFEARSVYFIYNGRSPLILDAFRDDSYECTSAVSDTKFSEVTLDGEWSDYDEKVCHRLRVFAAVKANQKKSGESVTIEGLQFRFQKTK